MNPTFLDNMSLQMAEVYGAITDQILANLASYFPYVKATGEITGSFQYQAAMLAKMGQVNRDTAEIILKGLKGADDALRQVLYATIYEALKDEEPKLRAAAQQGLLMGSGFLPPEVDPGTMQAFQSYYRQSADKLNLVNTVMLESTENAYRNTITDAVTRLQKIERTQSILNIGAGETAVGVSSWNEAMHRSVQKMVQNGLTGFVDHGGHKWQPETYVAMDIRTTVFNTARAAVWERSEQYGEDLYQVSSHNGARPLCYPWQAKVISRTDTVRTVYDFEGNEVQVHAQSETSYGQPAGLFGINCKHYPMTFIPGISSIRGQPQSPEENEKAYEESQEQRALERKLRREKLDLEVMKAQGADEAAILAQRDRVRAASADIDEFCNATGRARRRNREYAPIMADFPDPDTYNPAQFERQTQQKMRKYFKDQAEPLQGMDPAAPYKNLKARTEPENQPQPAPVQKPAPAPAKQETKAPEPEEENTLEALFADLWNETPEQRAEREKSEREAAERERAEEAARQKDAAEVGRPGRFGLHEPEYPKELRLNKYDTTRLGLIEHYYDKDFKMPDSQARIQDDELMVSRGQQYDKKIVAQKREEQETRLADAEEEIRLKKESGYKGESSKEKYARWEAYKQAKIEYDENDYWKIKDELRIGESGIRYWQQERKAAQKELERLQFLEKLIDRLTFATTDRKR